MLQADTRWDRSPGLCISLPANLHASSPALALLAQLPQERGWSLSSSCPINHSRASKRLTAKPHSPTSCRQDGFFLMASRIAFGLVGIGDCRHGLADYHSDLERVILKQQNWSCRSCWVPAVRAEMQPPGSLIGISGRQHWPQLQHRTGRRRRLRHVGTPCPGRGKRRIKQARWVRKSISKGCGAALQL